MGGKIAHHKDNRILKLLNNNHFLVKQLRQNEFIQYLKKDINKLWRVLGNQIERGSYYTSEGMRRCHRLNGSHRTDYYKQLETQVMKSVRKYARTSSARLFLEHDGFRSDKFFTPDELSYQVDRETGFQVKFSWTKMELDVND